MKHCYVFFSFSFHLYFTVPFYYISFAQNMQADMMIPCKKSPVRTDTHWRLFAVIEILRHCYRVQPVQSRLVHRTSLAQRSHPQEHLLFHRHEASNFQSYIPKEYHSVSTTNSHHVFFRSPMAIPISISKHIDRFCISFGANASFKLTQA